MLSVALISNKDEYFPDVNECVDGSHTCDEIATCVNTEGSYNCTCPPGYIVNGSRCQGMLLPGRARVRKQVIICPFSMKEYSRSPHMIGS